MHTLSLDMGYAEGKTKKCKVISVSTINEIEVQWLPNALIQREKLSSHNSLLEFRIMHNKRSQNSIF